MYSKLNVLLKMVTSVNDLNSINWKMHTSPNDTTFDFHSNANNWYVTSKGSLLDRQTWRRYWVYENQEENPEKRKRRRRRRGIWSSCCPCCSPCCCLLTGILLALVLAGLVALIGILITTTTKKSTTSTSKQDFLSRFIFFF